MDTTRMGPVRGTCVSTRFSFEAVRNSVDSTGVPTPSTKGLVVFGGEKTAAGG